MQENKFKDHFLKTPDFLKRLFVRAEDLWEILPYVGDYLGTNIAPKMEGLKVGEVYLDNNVKVGKGTIIEHGAMIKGPAVIGENCEIRNGAYIRGNVFVGDNCVIGHCSEVKNSIVMDNTHLGHFNYVGDSILGREVNLGAGSILANLRFDQKNILIDGKDTGLKKFGAILGDNCQIGCNTVLNPGTIFKKGVAYAGNSLKSGIYNEKQIKELLAK
ncbi:MAG: hypothetical protein GF347_03065 [Candidatus Moranbacteria bacterium]|nr:hypothetical protein [Candidatus Moranbacteria bacterium]